MMPRRLNVRAVVAVAWLALVAALGQVAAGGTGQAAGFAVISDKVTAYVVGNPP